MDIKYPLEYTGAGDILTIEDTSLSYALHLLDTIQGERTLFPNYGVALDILFSTSIPELVTERLRIGFQQLEIPATINIVDYKNGNLKLKLDVAGTVREVEIGGA